MATSPHSLYWGTSVSCQMYTICQGFKFLWAHSTPMFLRMLGLIQVSLSAITQSSVSEMFKRWNIVPRLWCLWSITHTRLSAVFIFLRGFSRYFASLTCILIVPLLHGRRKNIYSFLYNTSNGYLLYQKVNILSS